MRLRHRFAACVIFGALSLRNEGSVTMDVSRLINGVMGQVGGVANQATTAVKQGGMPTGLVGGAAAGGLVALLMSNKKARKMGGKVLAYGGLAAVGGLAYKAWSDHKAAQQGAPTAPVAAVPATAALQTHIPTAPADSGFDIASQTDRDGSDLRLTLVRAMISSAKSDGHIDADEHTRIQAHIQSLDLSGDEKGFLFDQLAAPSDPITIARLANNDAQAAEIYVASALAVDADTPEEKRYLDRLSDALRLPDGLRAQLDAQATGLINVVA